MWDLILAGRIMMIPIALCSLVGLAVFLERLIVLRRRRIVVPEIISTVVTLPRATDFSVAYAVCDRHPGPFANVIRSGLDHAESDWQITRDALQESGRQESVRLMRNLRALETIAAVSPLLGLLGTVTGMIRTFAVTAKGGLGDPLALSSGISEAMITTAAGLIVGIPALVAFHWLESRANSIVFDIEVYASQLLDTLRARRLSREPRGAS
ncbi:MAG TPA: MotA/TolQ/ExbB proton channel family protein [Candidatus Krumholzibacteria bacterium]|nr:MotA/TolQ/ExbB proton channel family protein [Candidatus Krumholzibacteria bacterium]HPD72707.1 MotA/TolQ/ExbB proton channel family protein [Candidatus Krumholzibacteria bacterium]HRY40361.1 MotA/TolQ/ExbB proton channel family protein [Candidatus Krumholzibacteria bacterium]